MKFNLGIIPKKKVAVSDIKQYLVDEYKNSNNLQKQIYKLKDELKEKVTVQIKYEATLVTLDEFKQRLKTKDERIKELDNQIKALNQKIKMVTDERNSKILDYKKLNKMYDGLKTKFDKEVIKESNIKFKTFITSKINEVNNIKGHVKKEDILQILGGNK